MPAASFAPAVTARYASLLGIPIDLMLISNTLAVSERHAGPDLSSDHLPVLSTVDKS